MYKHPMNYTKENVSEIMNKPLKILITEYGSDNVIEEIDCEIINCLLASNHPYLPSSFRIKTEKGERNISVAEIKKFEDQ